MDQRSTTFEKSIAIGKEYQRRTRMLILRAAMLKNQIHVKVIIIVISSNRISIICHPWAHGVIY